MIKDCSRRIPNGMKLQRDIPMLTLTIHYCPGALKQHPRLFPPLIITTVCLTISSLCFLSPHSFLNFTFDPDLHFREKIFLNSFFYPCSLIDI